MSRFTIECPEDLPQPVDFDYPARRADSLNDIRNERTLWDHESVCAYRTALISLGFTREQIESQIAKDCGPTYSEGFMRVRQAS